MKSDVYVSGVETVVPEGVFIYSQTDLHGKITVANEAFAALSGYSPDEMIGRPHSIVRHPDMPKEAFADMWKSLKAGRPWQAVVKNRRKDGGFYWVLANASPVREDGRVVGYQSLRMKPTREQIKASADAYKKILNGSKSLIILEGKAVPAQSWAANFWCCPNNQFSSILLVSLLASTLGIVFNFLGMEGKTIHTVENLLYVVTAVGALYCLTVKLVAYAAGSFEKWLRAHRA